MCTVRVARKATREGGLRCELWKGEGSGTSGSTSTSTSTSIAIAIALAFALPAAAEPPADAASLTFHGRLEWLTAAGWTAPRETAVNPGNAVLALPAAAGGSELRPDLRLEGGDRLRLVVRPRLRLEATRARAAGEWKAEHGDATAEWLELFGAWRVDDRLELTYGLQNFQWGPGELMSPSNRLFHESGFARDPLYVVRGKHLVRVNASAGKAFSAVVLAEVASNGEAPFVAGAPFEPKVEGSSSGRRGTARRIWASRAAPGSGPAASSASTASCRSATRSRSTSTRSTAAGPTRSTTSA